MSVPQARPDGGTEFDQILSQRLIRPVFQPVVALEDGLPVGYEALARGPEGSRFVSPDALFTEAERRGVVTHLDWICCSVACEAALRAGGQRFPLFLNVEPQTVGSACPPELVGIYEEVLSRLDLVIELTEREVRNPAELIRFVIGARTNHNRLALDDVGADPASLNMMALVRPDVIKLDRAVVQGGATWAQSYVVNAVLTEAGRTGAVVLAEGIETREHLDAARAVGARLGQGWLFGRPGPLPDVVELSPVQLPRVSPLPSTNTTPFAVVEQTSSLSPATLAMLTPMRRLLEQTALHTDDATMLFAVVQDRDLDAETRMAYSHIANRGVAVTAYGPGLPPLPGPGIQGVSLAADDPLAEELAVLVIGSYFAAGLIARARPHAADDEAGPTYDFVLTYDRLLVTEAGCTLINRIPELTYGFGSPHS
ncbi:EAL domain-containing protein [Catellatospora paridis]|uniref:EAL domain-containing protein n=1 Tax=Catellatospora paridis TaxID=1617086 RepID=UPI0018AFB7C3|nr:EAL domain-containing protein [Catellatospora paridis]